MDFSLNDTQSAVREAAAGAFAPVSAAAPGAPAPPDGDGWFDRRVWERLAATDLLGTSLSEDVGGSGLGLLETCVLLEEQGRHLIRVPAAVTLAVAGPAIDRFGSDHLRSSLLPKVVRGDGVLSAALVEPRTYQPDRVRTTLTEAGSGRWRLHGEKTCVALADLADRILTPARLTDGRIHVVSVDPAAAGVHLSPQQTTNGQPEFALMLDGATVTDDEILGAAPDERHTVHAWMLARATVATCAVQLGVTEQILTMTASYTSGRRQFGRPIATFQAVALRAADAYVAVECIRNTLWQAAWRLAAGRDAGHAIQVAKFWAAEAGARVAATGQHLHGGIGYDTDYPLHRYTLWAKHHELSLGSAHAQLAHIGSALAHGEGDGE